MFELYSINSFAFFWTINFSSKPTSWVLQIYSNCKFILLLPPPTHATFCTVFWPDFIKIETLYSESRTQFCFAVQQESVLATDDDASNQERTSFETCEKKWWLSGCIEEGKFNNNNNNKYIFNQNQNNLKTVARIYVGLKSDLNNFD